MPTTPPLTQSIGLAENALRAILDRLLVAPGLRYDQWVALNVIARAEAPLSQDQLMQHLVAALKREPATLLPMLDELTARDLITAPVGEAARVTLTPHGEAQVRSVRRNIADVTERVYGDLPPGDLTTTHRVLEVIAERASRELGR